MRTRISTRLCTLEGKVFTKNLTFSRQKVGKMREFLLLLQLLTNALLRQCVNPQIDYVEVKILCVFLTFKRLEVSCERC